ncbi:MAG: winged helix DNA-binding domain-containing protein [Candidatus Heimdallarchaeota archaeon]|nr:winged helix DNA-binding domain-containing protein [Candidatus Heimdallarchaeota archaeon]
MLTSEILKISHLSGLGLWGDQKFSSVEALIEKMNYIQIDAVYTVARSQDLVAHTRLADYKEASIWQNILKGNLFEGWAHAKCILPAKHFDYYYSAAVDRRDQATWWQNYLDKYPEWPYQVLEQMESSETLSTSDIELPGDFPWETGWSSPGKQVLNYLETRGYILATRDDFFNLHFVPVEKLMKIPDEIIPYEERFRFFIETTLDAIGPAPVHRLLHYKYNHRIFKRNGKSINPRSLIGSMMKKDILREVEIDGQKYLGRERDFEKLEDLALLEEDEYGVYLLSPFDNSLWSREALLAQYNFDYKMEIYVPKKKRVYGYYVMPILYGPNFVGRVDVKYDRESKTMLFIRWHWEENFEINQKFIDQLRITIMRFCSFHGAENVQLGNFKNIKKSEIELP